MGTHGGDFGSVIIRVVCRQLTVPLVGDVRVVPLS